MDDRLKELMQDLGSAINGSLSESDRIAEAIGEIKRAGYDIFLVLEAVIGFNKREEFNDRESPAQPVGRATWNSQDKKFLKALKIKMDVESK